MSLFLTSQLLRFFSVKGLFHCIKRVRNEVRVGQCFVLPFDTVHDSLSFLGGRGKRGEWPFSHLSCFGQHQELLEILDVRYGTFSESGYHVTYVHHPHRLEFFVTEKWYFFSPCCNGICVMVKSIPSVAFLSPSELYDLGGTLCSFKSTL